LKGMTAMAAGLLGIVRNITAKSGMPRRLSQDLPHGVPGEPAHFRRLTQVIAVWPRG